MTVDCWGENNKKGHQQFDNEKLNPIPLSLFSQYPPHDKSMNLINSD